MVLAGIVVVALCSPAATAKMTLKDKVGEKEVKLQIYGFSQLEARGGDGWQMSKKRIDDGLDFSAQRIRVGFNYFHAGPIAGKLFLDFNQSATNDEAGLPKYIKDAFVAYKFNNSAFLRLGMIKTPLGMSFTVPGWNLDNIERSGLDKGLVLERDLGLMLSGRLMGQERWKDKKQMKVNGLEMGAERQGYGFGYDIGVFNPAGRSSAVIWDAAEVSEGQCSVSGDTCSDNGDCPDGETCMGVVDGGTVRGDGLAYVGRVHFDWGPELHVEAAYGTSQQAGGNWDNPNTSDEEESEDYSVFDVGVASELWDSGVELKFEYIDGSDLRGVDGWDQSCWSATVGWLFVPYIEAVLKTYQADTDKPSGDDIVSTDLGNTYIGLNFYPKRVSDKHRDLQRHKIVLNYVIANGDDVDSDTPWQGIGGYKDDTWAAQWQYKF
jgi:hypothetical protein